MSKTNTKKMLTVMISIAMVFSALAILSFAAEPAFAQSASGTFYANIAPASSPSSSGGTILTPLASPAPMIFLNHNSEALTAGQTVDFYWSTTTAASGIVGGVAGTATASSSGELSGSFVLSAVPSSGGSYYLLAASEGSLSGGVASSTGTFSISAQANYPITLQLSLDEATYSSNVTSTVGSTVYYDGSGYNSSSAITIAVFTNSGGAPATSFTVTGPTPDSNGAISGSFTIPSAGETQGYYYVIAYDAGTNGGHGTAQSVLGVTEAVSPVFSVPAGSLTFSQTLTGTGFSTSSTFAASTQATPTNTVTIGGVDTILSGTPSVSSTGGVTFTITGLASTLTTTGPYSVIVNDKESHSFTFADQAYVSSTSGVPTIYVTPTSGNVGDSMSVVAINFAGTVAIHVYMDGNALISSTTDANGFKASASSLVVPTIPGGTYTVYAYDANGHTASASFTINASMSVEHSSASISGEYVPTSTSVVVAASGLSANTEYVISDTGLVSTDSTSNLVASGETITYTTGSAGSDSNGVVTDSTGSLSVTYSTDYTGIATGTSESITVGSLPSVSYLVVGSVTITSSATSYLTSTGSATTTATATVSGLVPSGATYAANVVTSGPYNFYIGTTELTFTSGLKHFSVTSTAAVTESFYLPTSVTDGVNTLTVNYGDSSSNILAHDYNFITSTPGSALVASDVSVNTHLSSTSASLTDAYTGDVLAFDVWDAAASTTVSVVYYNNLGKSTTSFTTDGNGAATYDFTVPNATAGTYLLTFTQNSVTSTTPSTYVVRAGEISVTQTPFAGNSYAPKTTESSLTPGATVTFYANSLTPDTSYNVYLGTSTSYSSSTYVSSFTTDQYGNGPTTGISVTIPSTSTPGTMYLGIATGTVATATGTLAAPLLITLTLSGYQVIYSNLDYSAGTTYAFPGQIVTFSWTPSSGPSSPGTTATTSVGRDLYGPVYVTVKLNSTDYVTVPVAYSSGTLSGSFLAPNSAAAGNWWKLTLSWSQDEYSQTLTGGTPTGQATIINTGTQATPTANLSLVQGAGALVVAVSTSGIATIISSTINSSMQVPISELNAAIKSLNATSVEITTSFGTMTTTLAAINATVSSVEKGQVEIMSDLGLMLTSLSSLNATLVSLHNDTVTLTSTVGTITTTLSGINATVSSNANGISALKGSDVTISTALGNISGQVTQVKDGIATINTSVGQIEVSTSQIKTLTSGISTTEIFLVVIIVLVLITLVISFLAVSAANKAARRVSEDKKM